MALSSWLNILLLAVVPFAMAAAGGYLAAILLKSPRQKIGFISFFVLLFLIGITAAVILQRVTDKDQRMAEEKSEKRDGVISNMNGQISSLSFQVTTLTGIIGTRLTANTPTHAPPPPKSDVPLSLDSMSYSQLVDYAHSFSEKLRAFERQKQNEITSQQFAMQAPLANLNSPEQKQIWNQQANQIVQIYNEYESDYRRQFWPDALVLRDEFERRYKKAGRTMSAPPTLGGVLIALDGSVAGVHPLSTLATYFDVLSRELPH